jgi:flagellar hook assembly protein FlgD
MIKHGLLVVCLAGCVVGEDTGAPPSGGPTPDADQGTPDADNTPTGTLNITVTTTPKGGEFAPANVVAVWVEDAAGAFVKTIDRHSQVRTASLIAWNQKAGPGDIDSVSSASRIDNATPINIMWKLKDRNKQPVPDGTYTIRMELADGNSTTIADNNEGTFTFVAGPAPQNQTGLTNGGFTNVTIDFTPPP